MTVLTIPERYSVGTARMQPDPEARHCFGGEASVSYRDQFPIDVARCAINPLADDLDWTPNTELCVVPEEMMALCRRCPGREHCLAWALTPDVHGEPQVGYWAGTTSRDRRVMVATGLSDVAAAERLQAKARADAIADALHPRGEGSLVWSRKGCHCVECRRAAADKKARERARRAAVAA